MRHDPIPPRAERPTQSFDLAAFAKQTVIDGILAAADDKGVMKERVMLAYECGHLDADETRLFVLQHGLEAA